MKLKLIYVTNSNIVSSLDLKNVQI